MKHSFYRPGAMLLALAIGSVAILSCNNEGSSGKTTDSTTTVSPTDSVSHSGHDTMAMADAPMAGHAEAALSGTYPDTTVTGLAKFDTAGGKVKLELEITVPKKANKSVAVHLHEHGDCADTAKMAHGHWNPTKAQHGKWGEGSFHLGDIGNVKLDAKGKGKITITTDLWTLGGPASSNIIGKAVIVHGGVDDFKTQPTGNAGTRIGCGVIR
ncbi:MAG: superoxide dismutase family protein [Citrobacter freundii]|nr:MAG: superoxide dismutase family protein [Citrobacter freundii]